MTARQIPWVLASILVLTSCAGPEMPIEQIPPDTRSATFEAPLSMVYTWSLQALAERKATVICEDIETRRVIFSPDAFADGKPIEVEARGRDEDRAFWGEENPHDSAHLEPAARPAPKIDSPSPAGEDPTDVLGDAGPDRALALIFSEEGPLTRVRLEAVVLPDHSWQDDRCDGNWVQDLPGIVVRQKRVSALIDDLHKRSATSFAP